MVAAELIPIAQWSAAVGVLTPLLVAVVNRSYWKPWVKALVAIVSCVVTGFLTAWFNGELNAAGLSTAVLVVLLASMATYSQFWKPSGITTKIEEKTTPG